jgi:toxin-antitoxin system PIN domain toxin
MNLPDINFWIALSFKTHVHHGSAKAWMQQAGKQSCCLCRVTQMGFLRLVTNPKVLRGDAVSMAQAWCACDELISDERVVFAEEPEGIEAAWRSLTQRQTFSPNLWSDAYLAAFAHAADFAVVTFDKAFAQYKNLRLTILS